MELIFLFGALVGACGVGVAMIFLLGMEYVEERLDRRKMARIMQKAQRQFDVESIDRRLKNIRENK